MVQVQMEDVSTVTPIDDEKGRTIFCANLSDKVTEALLYELFLQGGPLENVHIPKDKDGRQRTFGFITYVHHVSVAYALFIFSGTRLFNREISLKASTPNKPNTDTKIANQNLKRSQSDSSVNQQPSKIFANEYSDNNQPYKALNNPFDKQPNNISHNPFDKQPNNILHNPFDKLPSTSIIGNPLADSPINFKRPANNPPKDMSALRTGHTSRGTLGQTLSNMLPAVTMSRKKQGSCLEIDVNALMRLSGNMLQLKSKKSTDSAGRNSAASDNPFRRQQQRQHQNPSSTSHHNSNRDPTNRSQKSNSDFKRSADVDKDRNYNHKRKR